MNAVRLANFVDTELTSDLQKVLFTQDNSGKFYLFGKYVIVNNKNVFKVYSINTGDKIDFLSLKNATAWCILNNAGKYKDANRIQNLDLKLSSIEVDIAVHKNIIKNAKTDFVTLISITKLQQDTYKRRMILSELSNYINTSKQIQDKNFRTKDSKIKLVR